MDPKSRAETVQALQQIAKDGSDLGKSLLMDFFVSIPSKEAGDNFAKLAKEIGFTVSVEVDDETNEWTCYCSKTLVPTVDAVVAIEDQLNQIASDFGGYIDGFGSYGNG